jgi:hypothetical protein
VRLGLCFISPRLTFGGVPNPNFWSEISETTTDVANAILQCDDWNPKEVYSPLHQKIPQPKQDSLNEPFAKALPMAVKIKVNNNGQTDCYIDDLTTIVVDIKNNVIRAIGAVLLAIFTLGRPTSERDPIKRLDLVSMSKLTAEGELEE